MRYSIVRENMNVKKMVRKEEKPDGTIITYIKERIVHFKKWNDELGKLEATLKFTDRIVHNERVYTIESDGTKNYDDHQVLLTDFDIVYHASDTNMAGFTLYTKGDKVQWNGGIYRKSSFIQNIYVGDTFWYFTYRFLDNKIEQTDIAALLCDIVDYADSRMHRNMAFTGVKLRFEKLLLSNAPQEFNIEVKEL